MQPLLAMVARLTILSRGLICVLSVCFSVSCATAQPLFAENSFVSVTDSAGVPIAIAADFHQLTPPSFVDLQLMEGNHLRFDPESTADLKRLLKQLEAPIKRSKSPPKGSTLREQSSYKQYRRGLQELRLLAETILDEKSDGEREERLRLMRETAAAINNDWRPRVPRRVESIAVLWLLFNQLQRPVGVGNSPALNLQPSDLSDLSRLDPLPSTFWQRPKDIRGENLFYGFGRTNLFGIEQHVCTYLRAKDSFGANPGFEVDCDDTEVKLKFAETFSEPFTARMFDALGFHADITDYAAEAKVRYDRRIFTEFHSRRKLETRFTFFGITYYKLSLQKHYDPFSYINSAILKNGERLTGKELKQRLLHNPNLPHPEDATNNFKPEIESQIDYLVTVPVNVQPKDPRLKNVGPWDHNQLDHPDRRELRGAGLLAAWLGFFDTRFDNTKLRILETKRGDRTVEYFSDLGGGMGETSGLLFQHGEQPNSFPWSFTLPPLEQGPHHLARPLRIAGYRPIAPTASFARMTIYDARWMARLISQLTESQITEALAASGFDSASAKLYQEKLVHRRDQMMIDLGLAKEIGLLRPRGIDEKFSYDPTVQGPFSAELGNGKVTKAAINGDTVSQGELIKYY